MTSPSAPSPSAAAPSAPTTPAPGTPEFLLLRRTGPAERWLEALPLGNGRIGAMVWGDPATPRFSLNEATLWSGSPASTQHRHTSAEQARDAIARSWELFRAGQVRAAQDAIEELGSSWSQAYLPVGDLLIEPGPSADAQSPSAANGAPAPVDPTPSTTPVGPSPAERILDLARAEHTIHAATGTQWTAVSLADEVLIHAMPWPADAPLPRLTLATPLHIEQEDHSPGALEMVLRAPSDQRAVDFRDEEPIVWDPEGASRAAVVVRARREGERLLVVCAIGTTWQGLGRMPDRPLEDVLAQTRAQAASALDRGEQQLRERHHATPLPDLDAVSLQFTGSPEAELLSTMWAYGRYLLAASSREGLPPATLQGIWNAQLEAPWSSNYTTNINLEMNHWGAGVAHLPTAARTFAAWVAMLREQGQETAQRLYGADGWALHHNADPWGYTDPVRGDASWATWPVGGLWMEREIDAHLRFSGRTREDLAAERFPALREAARFALALLREGDDGHLVTFPSISPENLYRDAQGDVVALTAGSGMDRWLVRETFTHLLEAAELTGHGEDAVVTAAREALGRVAEVRIGADGRVIEWHADDLPEVEPTHRHLSHLGFLYPGDVPATPEQEAAATATMLARGDEATGWSLVWKTGIWARLGRADRVQRLLEMYLRPAERAGERDRAGLYPNLFSAHPPFQIDGNLGIIAALAECLVQSHRGDIELLPALAPMLAHGSMRGLRAHPGIEVEMTWQAGEVTALALRAVGPGAIGTHTVRHGRQITQVKLTDLNPVTVDVEMLRSR
ncbi:glycoside hydrolase N-terminal domain-containing protein [Brachybacterium sp. UMB0905]|uniref:glycosyl hydrolase family 95 catalytic domain-containing protein n=1 Tax=Brachybacterium sp. UMB0905 TaxID=2069310 RepID=UPI000C7F8A6A|nr:glycoside hydrolase N-terminal domain-containing protein [Brachybacterium sp. UMB0905]PMC74571.1 hypothetical protein CJ197_12775 [Brachybacterium sp. UMB0905]